MKLFYSTLVFTLLLSFAARAQNRVVSGKITAKSSNESLIGVSVLVKGTQTFAVSNESGVYSISIPANVSNPTLVFRFMGFRNQEVKLGTNNKVDVVLEDDISSLNDVVVVGYQTMKRKDLTGSVSSVNAKQLKDIPINSAAQALTGRLAGVQITGNEGSPNADVTIRVRGGGSITQDNAPLYIIDGIQVENGLSAISPQDIASIDVLKDASTTAIYGARGANGVVIITTKSGTAGKKPTLSYSGFYGVRKLANKLAVMRPYDFITYQYERSRGNSTDSTAFAGHYGSTWDTLSVYKDVPFVDWQDEMFGRTAAMQTHNISLSGGSSNTTYNLSLTSNKEDGIMQGSDMDRKLVSFKFDHNFSKALKIGFNTRYNNTKVSGAGTSADGSSATNRLRHSIKYKPVLGVGEGLTDYDAEYALETNSNSLALINPILLNAAEYRRNIQNLINISGYADLQLAKFASFRSTFGYDYFTTELRSFDDTITNNSKQNSASMPLASIQNQKRSTINLSNVLTFSNAKYKGGFNDKNSWSVLLGQEIYQTKIVTNIIETRYFPLGVNAEYALANMGLGTPPVGVTQPRPVTSEVQAKLASFFGRLNYSYADRYLLSFTMRSDGSSKFADGLRWGYFPSGSLAWRVSNEEFFKPLSTRINDLKIRGSFGKAGNNRISDFMYLMQYNALAQYSLNEQIIPAYQTTGLANKDLVWESTLSRNIGFDVSILNNRLQVSADYYKNETDNLLVSVPIPSPVGYTKQMQNVGKTSNRGVELQINAVPIAKKDFSWNVNFNISFNKNRVESLGNRQTFYLENSGWALNNSPADFLVQVGQPVGTIWGQRTDGWYTLDDFDYDPATEKYTLKKGVPDNSSVTSVTPYPGVVKFKDLDGDGIVNDKDRTIIGNTTPKYFGGLNQQFTYKNFDLSVFLNFQGGNDVYNANKLEFTNGYTPNANMLAIMNGRWKNIDENGNVVKDPARLAEINKNATIWSASTSGNSFVAHSWAIEDGSFIRVNNVTLGYTLPKHLLNVLRIQTARFYFTANNLGVITGYSGYDPEVNARRSNPVTQGVDYSAYPRSRTFLLGVNLSL